MSLLSLSPIILKGVIGDAISASQAIQRQDMHNIEWPPYIWALNCGGLPLNYLGKFNVSSFVFQVFDFNGNMLYDSTATNDISVYSSSPLSIRVSLPVSFQRVLSASGYLYRVQVPSLQSRSIMGTVVWGIIYGYGTKVPRSIISYKLGVGWLPVLM